jgi:hypothetical protein
VSKIVFFSLFLFAFNVFALSQKEVAGNPAVLLAASKEEIVKFAGTLTGPAKLKLNNFARIKDALDDCFPKNKDGSSKYQDSRQLQKSLFSGAIYDPCLAKALGYNNPQRIAYDLSGLAKEINFSSMKKTIQERALSTSAKAILDYRSQYDGAMAAPDPNDSKAMNIMTNGFCQGCDREQKEFFRNAYIGHAKANPSTATPSIGRLYSTDNLINLQNDAIEGFNKSIDTMEAAKNAKDEAKFNEAYAGYLEDYQRFTSTHAGALFMTDSVRGVTGKIITPEDASKTFYFAGQTKFPRHKKLTINWSGSVLNGPGPRSNVLKAGLQEIETKVSSFMRSVIKANSFKDLLKVDPALVGQLLVLNPNLAKDICKAAQEVMVEDKETKETIENVDRVIDLLDYASMSLMLVGGSGLAIKAVSTLVRTGFNVGLKKRFMAAGQQVVGALGYGATGNSSRGVTQWVTNLAATTGALSEAGHLTSDGQKLAQIQGQSDVLLASRMARATTEIDAQRLLALENQWADSLSNLTTGSLLNSLPLAHGLMKIRSSSFMKSLLGGKSDLGAQLNADQRLAVAVSKLTPAQNTYVLDAMSKHGITVDEMATLFASASTQDGRLPRLLTILRSGDSDKITKLRAAAKQGASCSI